MDPTMHLIARSVQRAVMSAPTTTVAEAAVAARRAARVVESSIDGLRHTSRVRQAAASAG